MTFFITTPIYYVNDKPHLGHAYTTVLADTLARYHAMFGEPSFMLTGTDEHGQKVQKAALKRGVEPRAHVDELVERFIAVWKKLDISYSFFIRTTNPEHMKVVQTCLQRLMDQGDIYSEEYEGWYSESEEIFYTDKDVVNGLSPEGKPVQKIREKNYFFRMSKYQEELVSYITSHPDFIMPEGKANEVLGFLRQPLNDLCISRPKSRLNWGITLPFDENFVTYVWFDALINYVSAIGYEGGIKQPGFDFSGLWANATHLIGKDILMTHAVYWPTMLMALGLSLPKHIYAHGWWLTDSGAKMSKSEGPVIEPLELAERIGSDAFRYFLCREVAIGNDAQFSSEALVNRLNADLANNFGNLVSRTTTLLGKYFDGTWPVSTNSLPQTKALLELAARTVGAAKENVYRYALHAAIGNVMDLLAATNRYIDEVAPWKFSEERRADIGECLSTICHILRLSGGLLWPVMPQKMTELLSRFEDTLTVPDFSSVEELFPDVSGTKVASGAGLFPRLDRSALESR